jgi:hypothetical protein
MSHADVWTEKERARLLRRITVGIMLHGWPDPIPWLADCEGTGQHIARWSIAGKMILASVCSQTIAIVGAGRYCVCWTAAEAVGTLRSMGKIITERTVNDGDDKADRGAAEGAAP